ncbi:hypothetical protein LPUS_04944 [Lasallia pustulata]|uniref:Auxin efflux carrier superfamily n=1 Tax=Lasallia pustulata TaxID=136370 RepID=A0A1W5CXL5_9LECA|nr:hypothetical protein LPUS_04944 [Lasallia pustulata]
MAIGFGLTRSLRLPSWVTPAICFNNTTSLPILLIQSLNATGVLSTLLMSDSDTTSQAITRANSYFLVCSIVSNSLTFALGPKLLGGEDSPDDEEEEEDKKLDDPDDQGINGGGVEGTEDIEQGRIQPTWLAFGSANGTADHHDAEVVTEETSLLPDVVVRHGAAAGHEVYKDCKKGWDRLPRRVQDLLEFISAFFNGSLIGAVVGGILGVVPSLHTAFFADQQDGGIFTAWLTSSIQNLGDLFASLQVVVVGVKLSSSLRKMKKGEDSGTVPWLPMCLILGIRFVLWPIASIGAIYLVAVRTKWLSNDPMLWFAMMLMPTGPPALKLTALADVNGNSDEDKMSIAKFLTISYAVSPLIAFAVVGSLKASEAAMAGM